MKKLANLKGTKVLNKNEQQSINGGARICGGTGGMPIPWPQNQCFGWGIVWQNNQCWACY